jgi:hypothetical protein
MPQVESSGHVKAAAITAEEDVDAGQALAASHAFSAGFRTCSCKSCSYWR